MAAPTYSATLHHLSPDAKVVSYVFSETQLAVVSANQIRDLLYAFSVAADGMTIYEPAMPEIRIKNDRDTYVVRSRYRRLFFVGHEAALRGEEHSVPYILSTITGTQEIGKPTPKADRPASNNPIAYSRPPMPVGGIPRWVKITAMSVLIVGCNAAAVWMLMRPPHSLAPPFDLLPEAESNALIAKTAGEYRTGSQAGDRRLLIDSDGTLRLAKYGALQAVGEETTRTVRGGLTKGRTVLVTSDPDVLSIKDPNTVVLYGTTYHRHIR